MFETDTVSQAEEEKKLVHLQFHTSFILGAITTGGSENKSRNPQLFVLVVMYVAVHDKHVNKRTNWAGSLNY